MVIVKVQTAGAGAGVGLVELRQRAPTRAAATRSSRASAIRRGIGRHVSDTTLLRVSVPTRGCRDLEHKSGYSR